MHFTLDKSDSTGAFSTIYQVAWSPSLKDSPPTISYFDNPIHLDAGTILRTTCEWMNSSNHVITYPAEMCMMFTYVAGTAQQLQCVPPP